MARKINSEEMGEAKIAQINEDEILCNNTLIRISELKTLFKTELNTLRDLLFNKLLFFSETALPEEL